MSGLTVELTPPGGVATTPTVNSVTSQRTPEGVLGQLEEGPAKGFESLIDGFPEVADPVGLHQMAHPRPRASASKERLQERSTYERCGIVFQVRRNEFVRSGKARAL
jgi:hypothetical protein